MAKFKEKQLVIRKSDGKHGAVVEVHYETDMYTVKFVGERGQSLIRESQLKAWK